MQRQEKEVFSLRLKRANPIESYCRLLGAKHHYKVYLSTGFVKVIYNYDHFFQFDGLLLNFVLKAFLLIMPSAASMVYQFYLDSQSNQNGKTYNQKRSPTSDKYIRNEYSKLDQLIDPFNQNYYYVVLIFHYNAIVIAFAFALIQNQVLKVGKSNFVCIVPYQKTFWF